MNIKSGFSIHHHVDIIDRPYSCMEVYVTKSLESDLYTKVVRDVDTRMREHIGIGLGEKIEILFADVTVV